MEREAKSNIPDVRFEMIHSMFVEAAELLDTRISEAKKIEDDYFNDLRKQRLVLPGEVSCSGQIYFSSKDGRETRSLEMTNPPELIVNGDQVKRLEFNSSYAGEGGGGCILVHSINYKRPSIISIAGFPNGDFDLVTTVLDPSGTPRIKVCDPDLELIACSLHLVKKFMNEAVPVGE